MPATRTALIRNTITFGVGYLAVLIVTTFICSLVTGGLPWATCASMWVGDILVGLPIAVVIFRLPTWVLEGVVLGWCVTRSAPRWKVFIIGVLMPVLIEAGLTWHRLSGYRQRVGSLDPHVALGAWLAYLPPPTVAGLILAALAAFAPRLAGVRVAQIIATVLLTVGLAGLVYGTATSRWTKDEMAVAGDGSPADFLFPTTREVLLESPGPSIGLLLAGAACFGLLEVLRAASVDARRT